MHMGVRAQVSVLNVLLKLAIVRSKCLKARDIQVRCRSAFKALGCSICMLQHYTSRCIFQFAAAIASVLWNPMCRMQQG